MCSSSDICHSIEVSMCTYHCVEHGHECFSTLYPLVGKAQVFIAEMAQHTTSHKQ